MKKWLLVVSIGIVVWACGGNTIDSDDPVVLYKKVCVNCHGNNGEMAVNGAKKFSESTLGLEERVLIITNGRSGTAMIGYSNRYTPEQIRAIAAYTIQLTKNAKTATE